MNKLRPKVSIVIPTYNRADKVVASLQSILEQDYDNLHIIIVDDGSKDDTQNVLSKYLCDRVVYILHKVNRGVTAAKNTGLDHLPGDTVYFTTFDSDDIMLPGAITSWVNCFIAFDNELSQVFGWCKDMDTGERVGEFPTEEGFVSLEDAITGRFKGEFCQLVNYSLLGNLRFYRRAGGGEGILWHQLIEMKPAYLIDKFVRLYDRSGNDRVSVSGLDIRNSTKKFFSYYGYYSKFKLSLRKYSAAMENGVICEMLKWACLAERNRYLKSFYYRHKHTLTLRTRLKIIAFILLKRNMVIRVIGVKQPAMFFLNKLRKIFM